MIIAGKAAQAYNSVLNSQSSLLGGEGAGIGKTTGGGDFASGFQSLVKGGIQSALDSNRKAEELSLAALDGKAEIADVVNAVNEAESTLRTMVLVRDKIITAYQEILRMPV